MEEEQERCCETLHCTLLEAHVAVPLFLHFEVHLLIFTRILLEGVLVPVFFVLVVGNLLVPEPGLVFELLVRCLLEPLVIDLLEDVVRNLENNSRWNS